MKTFRAVVDTIEMHTRRYTIKALNEEAVRVCIEHDGILAHPNEDTFEGLFDGRVKDPVSIVEIEEKTHE